MKAATIAKRIRPYLKRLGVKRTPPLIYDSRTHHFSEWGLSANGKWWYCLSPERNSGVIGNRQGVLYRFKLKDEPASQQTDWQAHYWAQMPGGGVQ